VSDTTYETNESMLSEARREAGILRDALAESERLREKAGSAILAMSSSLDLAIEKAEEFRNARDKAEELVAALKKAIAQSSTQYREMVKALEECKRLVEVGEWNQVVSEVDAVLERSTP
jgi:DNA-binding ferritin-like protein